MSDRMAELDQTIRRSILSVFIDHVEVDGDAACVVLRSKEDRQLAEYYFEKGDRVVKIQAIETVRWFRDLPWMQVLRLTIFSPEGEGSAVSIDRSRVEDVCKTPLGELRGKPWQMFLLQHDSFTGRRELLRRIRSVVVAEGMDGGKE